LKYQFVLLNAVFLVMGSCISHRKAHRGVDISLHSRSNFVKTAAFAGRRACGGNKRESFYNPSVVGCQCASNINYATETQRQYIAVPGLPETRSQQRKTLLEQTFKLTTLRSLAGSKFGPRLTAVHPEVVGIAENQAGKKSLSRELCSSW
jgi:hypothetical protein